MSDEKTDYVSTAADIDTGTVTMSKDSRDRDSESEVFQTGEGHVDFRTVGWVRASMFVLKQTFATGVLSIPSALYHLGSVAGCIFIVFWGILNTYMAYIQGKYKLAHPKMHTVMDAAEIATFHLSGGNKFWTKFAKGLAWGLYIFSWLLCIGLAVLAIGTALNAISHHGACTVGFNIVGTIIITIAGSIRKIHGLGWILWIGFASAVTSIMIIVIGVTIPDRPAAAPKTGPYELGYYRLPPAGTTFAQAWAASIAVFASSSNTCGYVPVMSEMRRPQDFFKSLYVAEAFITSAYLSMATTVYAYCGQWVTSPSLGSAGPTLKIVSYAIAIPGLIATGMICVHVPAKSFFVLILRGTRHLTENTFVHWAVWIGCTVSCGLLGWLLAEAIPFFTSLVSLIGSLGFGPLGICLPPILWFSLYPGYYKGTVKQQAYFWFHIFIFMIGLLVLIGGTYANIQNIYDQFKAGDVGSAFSCADNSGSTAG